MPLIIIESCFKSLKMMNNRILIFVRGFYPSTRYGGPPVSVMNVTKNVKDYFDFFIVTTNKEKGESRELSGITKGWVRYDFGKVKYLNYRRLSNNIISHIMKDIEPALIYNNSFFDARLNISLIKISNKQKIPIFIAPRGQLFESTLKIKEMKKKMYLFFYNNFIQKKFLTYHATNIEEKKSIIKYLGQKSQTIVLNNLPRTFKQDIVSSNKRTDSIRIIYFSRIHPKKNLYFAIEVLNEIKKDVEFDIYGFIEDYQYWSELTKLIGTLPMNISVNYKGELPIFNPEKIIMNYDLFFLPTKSENYGHAIAEALSIGIPVLISDQTPWKPDKDHNAVWTIPLNDRGNYVNVINELSALDRNQMLDVKKKALEYAKKHIYSIENTNYKMAFDNLINRE